MVSLVLATSLSTETFRQRPRASRRVADLGKFLRESGICVRRTDRLCSQSIDESCACQGLATFRPCFGGFSVAGRAYAARIGLMPTMALVDDDRNILTSVSIALEAEGYRIMTYTDGASALDGFKTRPPDLAILDIKMPRMDGMETLRRLRQKSDMPVIFLTSKDEEIDELFGLKMGADDFIRKPFSQRLLVERVKAILRRSTPKDGSAPKETDAAKVLERGLLRMDPERHTCTWKNEPVTLTVTEFLILQALASRPGVVKSRNALLDAAYDDQVYVDDRTIDSHIKRIRKKFKLVDDPFDMLETIRGVGYRFREKEFTAAQSISKDTKKRGYIFISYRRDDAAGHAGRVHDRLRLEFGSELLFMDVDAIPLGTNFVKALREQVAKCDILLAVIGTNWLRVRDEHGNRRLDDANDFLRIEIATALERGIPVIPILLDGTSIPKADQLPKDLHELPLRQGLHVRHDSFHNDMDKLIRGLKSQLNQGL